MKGYKVTNCAQDKKFGVVGCSLSDVFVKGCIKLKMDSAIVTMILFDGTVVDDEDYFQTLPAQTLFMFRLNGEPFQTGADLVYNVLTAVNKDILKSSIKVKSFMNENVQEKIKILSSVLKEGPSTNVELVAFSLRTEHPDWFKDLDTRAKTKEEYMFKRCQERIRGYFYKTKSDMIKSDLYTKQSKCQPYLDDVYKEFSTLLSERKHHGYYFDRLDPNALCHRTGMFVCQGAWNKTCCTYENDSGHKINPYQSRESRIIFSTWNLDHWVERSRSVLPALFEASKQAADTRCSINTQYFYNLLFTTVNLKLVHIVCHDKGQHVSAKCDPKLYLNGNKGIKRKLGSDEHFSIGLWKTEKYSNFLTN